MLRVAAALGAAACMAACIAASLPARAAEARADEPARGAAMADLQLALADSKPARGAQEAQPPATLAVLYPQALEPYRSIFAGIVKGIESGAKAPVQTLAVAPEMSQAEVAAYLKANGIKVVIALGQQGWRLASGLDGDIQVVVGGVVKMPEPGKRAYKGVSLVIDPALLFRRLKSLQPGVKKVHVVYSASANAWLIKIAKDAARNLGLELVAHEAPDLSSAAQAYEAIVAGATEGRDALWLPQDSQTMDEVTLLSMVLRQSWARNIPVFSSNISHVKRGSLFALYPDNVGMGRTLAGIALASGREADKSTLALLEDVNGAVNLRTGTHVGISLSPEQKKDYAQFFPEE